jgi:hypothetical protein
MLQLIGWLLCVHLLAQALGLFGHGREAHAARARPLFYSGGGVAIVAALLFGWLIIGQTSSM